MKTYRQFIAELGIGKLGRYVVGATMNVAKTAAQHLNTPMSPAVKAATDRRGGFIATAIKKSVNQHPVFKQRIGLLNKVTGSNIPPKI